MKGIYTMNRCTKEYNKLREELAGLENKHSEVRDDYVSKYNLYNTYCVLLAI